MKLTQGLNRDCLPADQPAGSYRYADNWLASEVPGSLVSEKGTLLAYQKDGYDLLALHVVRQDNLVGFYRKSDSYAVEIGLWDGKNFTTSFSSAYIELATIKPLQVAHFYTIDNELILVWTDGVNPVRLLNLDKPVSVMSTLQAKALNLIPTGSYPLVSLSESSDPGNIESGGYSFLLGYVLSEGGTGNAYGTYGSALIGTGIDSVQTSAAIKFTITNLDPAYSQVKLFAVRDQVGVRQGLELATLSNINGSASFTWTGQVVAELDAAELLLQTTAYRTAQTLTGFDDQLLIGNLTLDEEIDFQPWANNIGVKWVSKQNYVDFNSKPDPLLISRSFMPSATYALYVAYGYDSGNISRWYHIPGRLGDSESPFTATDPFGLIRDCDITDYSSTDGAMGLHRNEDEFYSTEDRWLIKDASGTQTGSLKGQHVRHHRMPSTGTVHGTGTAAAFSKDIGLQFTGIVIPAQLAGKITSLHFGYAVRDIANMDVVTIMPVLDNDFAKFANDSSTILKPAPSTKVVPGKIRGYDFGIMLKKPALRNLFLVTEYDNGKHVKATASFGIAPGVSALSRSGLQYVPAGNILLDNDEREDAFLLTIDYVYGGSAAGRLDTKWDDTNQMGKTIPLASLRQATRNLYVSLENQNIARLDCSIALNGSESLVNSSATYEGDVSRQDQTVRFMRARSVFPTGTPNFSDNTTVYKSTSQITYPLYSRLPISKGYSVPALEPVLKSTVKKYDGSYLNQYNLSASYELTNTFRGGSVATAQPPVTRLPVRIARSLPQGSESRRLGWRKFPALDYTDHKLEAGELINLEKLGETLVIHHTGGVYRTLPRQRLQTENLNVYLGMGDLFSQTPQEIVSAPYGYAGIRYPSGTSLGKFGYLFVDDVAGKIFLLSDKLQEISAQGLRQWSRENLPFALDEQLPAGFTRHDNPFLQAGAGYALATDEGYNRLLITKRDYTLVDPALWGDPADLLTGDVEIGKYYLVDGELCKCLPPVDDPYNPYPGTLQWAFDARYLHTVPTTPHVTISWLFDGRYLHAVPVTPTPETITWAYDARYQLL